MPFSYVLDDEQHDVFSALPKIRTPMVFAAGEHDDIVPPNHVRYLYEAAVGPKDFVLVRDVDHDHRWRLEDIHSVNTAVIQSLRKLGVM